KNTGFSRTASRANSHSIQTQSVYRANPAEEPSRRSLTTRRTPACPPPPGRSRTDETYQRPNPGPAGLDMGWEDAMVPVGSRNEIRSKRPGPLLAMLVVLLGSV